MKALTPPELRRFAEDIEAAYANDTREGRDISAFLVAEKFRAKADLEDALCDTHSGIADELLIEQTVPLLGTIKIKGGKKIYMEHPYNEEGKQYNIHVAFQWYCSPISEINDGKLMRIWIGAREKGPLAQYDASDNQWYELKNNGNYGKRYACGGTWRSVKINTAPKVFLILEKIMELSRVEKAKAALKAAKLDLFAHQQACMGFAYARQASKPIYAGQEMICAEKSENALYHSGITSAKAELIRAEAGL